MNSYLQVRRKGWRDGKEFDRVTYYISSESASAWRLAKWVRGHRKIENTLHWTKDVLLKEDKCGLKVHSAAAHAAMIRNMAFNLWVMSGYHSISEGISAMGEKVSALWSVLTGTGRPSHG